MTPKDVVRAFHAAFVARDVDALCALYADDAVNHQVAEEPLHGKAAIRRSFEEFFRAFSSDTTEVVNLFEDGEWGIWKWRGGNPLVPGASVVYGCGFFQVRDGLIVLQRGYWDKLTFLRAHGLTWRADADGRRPRPGDPSATGRPRPRPRTPTPTATATRPRRVRDGAAIARAAPLIGQ